MNHNEWQTDDSILAAPADEATEQAADLVIAAADEDKLTPAKLGQLLVSVGRTVSDEDDVLTLLQRVVEIAHDAIDGADSTSLTIDLGGRTYTAVHTDDRTLRVDSEQYDAGDGPCLEASRTGAVVLVNADDPEDRWPRFTAAAREEEILSFLAAPLITGEQSLGSFNLYGHARSAFDTLDAEILELLTTTVSRTLGDFARFKSARDVADSIQGHQHPSAHSRHRTRDSLVYTRHGRFAKDGDQSRLFAVNAPCKRATFAAVLVDACPRPIAMTGSTGAARRDRLHEPLPRSPGEAWVPSECIVRLFVAPPKRLRNDTYCTPATASGLNLRNRTVSKSQID
jgi:GAF domain